MKPQARIQATIDILEKLQTSRIPMDSVVGDYMRYRRYIGSKDRAVIAERTYDIMRCQARIRWWLEKIELEDTPRARVLAYLALGEAESLKRLADLFDGSKYAPDPLDEVEQAALSTLQGQALEPQDMPETIRAECPPHYEESLKSYFGANFVQEMQAMQQSATLDLRVNTFLSAREKVQEYLRADGVETQPTPYSPWGLRCAGKAYLAKTKAMAKGWIEIQDEGSQLIAAVCEARPGMQVLDYCAGAGGKTLALGAAMKRKGRIVAMDLDERRLEKGRQRFKKARLSDIIELRPLSEAKHQKWLRRQKEKFDIVLTDVPCTGTGTWRRNPDMRWRTYGPELSELVEIQADILDKVAKCVKPGGRLVYATCSLLPEENEHQVQQFLERHDGFAIQPIASVILSGSSGEASAKPESEESHETHSEILRHDVPQDDTSNFMRLTPLQHKTDGFFAAVLVKKAEA